MNSVTVIHGIIAAGAGGVLGSCANLLIHRLPRGDDVVVARSRCPSCDRVLGGRDLVPVFSWLALRGRCRACGARIGWRYPLVEVTCAGFAVFAWAVFGISWAGACVTLLTMVLLVASVIDWQWLYLPDETVASVAVLGVLWQFSTGSGWQQALLIALATGAGMLALGLGLRWVFYRLRGLEALGLGDVKLLSAAGLWLEPVVLPWFLVSVGGIGILTGVLWRAVSDQVAFPFGPAIAAGLGGIVFAGALV